MGTIRMGRYLFYKSFFRARTLMAAVLTFAIVHLFSVPFRDLCKDANLFAAVLPLFTLLGDNYMASGLLFCIWIWFISSVPYLDRSQNLILVRCGYADWC